METTPAVILGTRPWGESGALASLLTEHEGKLVASVPGGGSRAGRALWQPGNLIEASWTPRPDGVLTGLKAEPVHQAAALALDDPLALDLLRAACAVADGALPERAPHPRSFHGLVRVVARLAQGAEHALADLIRWEALLLGELGYGLDLSRCAATGRARDLVFVSPRSGRAVCAEAGAPYAERLLPLPPLMLDPTEEGDPEQWRDGLKLTGFFLARDLFGAHHQDLPAARHALADRVTSLAG
ncbi:MAG: DNA repair protein RecO [Acetobacteraceae bacterium]|nr:DNA repair protein RecO [Acetobacteraceae bacterium]